MKTEYQIIAVDFDGTLCTDCFPKIGQPNTALIELLKGLRRQGRQIILWTCRCGNQLEEAVEWCRKWELEFDAVNENLPEIIERYGSDGRKIYADVYIDDKSCFPWEVKRMRKLDYEFIFTCGIVAFIAALGMVTGIVVLAGAKIYVYNLPLIVGSFLAIGGLLWGLLLVLK